jgi:galactose mutarotase-like enzyme
VTTLTLTHGSAEATIALAGAEPRSWKVDGRDLLWPGDPAIWKDISPVLYPVVGWTRDGARVDGRHYALGLHGFAQFETFTVERATADAVRLSLRDNERTRAVYPFPFMLEIEYRLTANALAMTFEVANPGERAVPYACGVHPGFRWPLGAGPREGALIRFEREERAEVPTIMPGGMVGPRTKTVPLKGRDLPLTDALFANDAVCFLDCVSRSLAFVDASGASITMEYPGFRHAALWTRAAAPFICLEAWTGYSDPQGFDGDLFDKPGMLRLEPGAHASHASRFVYRAA